MALTPAIFFGHGSPVVTLTANPFTNAWREIGHKLARPKAVLMVSAHWYTHFSGVLVSSAPETIHDFGGFQRELFDIRYPAPGDPALARRVQKLLSPMKVELADDWGYDHGTWTVMRHVFPAADVPIVQLSIDAHLPGPLHYEIGRRLAVLREEGVLIVGSGNIVHNLRLFEREPGVQPFDWAQRFDARVRTLLQQGDHERLANYASIGPDSLLAVPTPDHYLPLLYVLGTHIKTDQLDFPVGGVEGGSMSMLSVRLSS